MSEQLRMSLVQAISGLGGVLIGALITWLMQRSQLKWERKRWAHTNRLTERDRVVRGLYDTLMDLYYVNVGRVKQLCAMMRATYGPATDKTVEQALELVRDDLARASVGCERRIGKAAVYLPELTVQLLIAFLNEFDALMVLFSSESPESFMLLHGQDYAASVECFCDAAAAQIHAVGNALDEATEALKPLIVPADDLLA